MKFSVGCEIDYEVTPPVTMFLSLRPRTLAGARILGERFEISPESPVAIVEDQPEENQFNRIEAVEKGDLSLRYHAEVSVRHRMVPAKNLRNAKPLPVDGSMLPWLFPSRYCQSDLLGRLAQQKFGKFKNAFDRARAVTHWIHTHVDYVLGASDSATSARDTLTECAGVCRDFAHLGIALCRALSIPARYVTGYSYQLDPPDFHACFEACIGDTWVLFDATHLAALNGLVIIGVGRDAADVSVSTTFGTASLKRQVVWCEAGKDFKPVKHDAEIAISLNRVRK